MKVLIATTELQGRRPGDYCRALDGELVTPVVAECSSGDRCGCARGFPGLASSRPSTTAMVVDRPDIGIDDLRDAVTGSLERDGWWELLRDGGIADGIDPEHDLHLAFAALVHEHVEAILTVCAGVAAGTVLERHGAEVTVRTLPHAA